MRGINNLIIACICFGLFSCEKVIEVKIREADQKYVIEGVIADEPGSCKVLLSRTKKIFESNQVTGISGATIKVSDNGVEHMLTETSPGVYESTVLAGIPGHRYDLSVAVNGELFTATCTMQQPVPIDTLIIDRGPFSSTKHVYVYYTDPAGINNGYRFIQYINAVKEPDIFWDNDEFTDGQTTAVRLDNGVNTGDTVLVELLSLDEPMYKYWSTLIMGGASGSSFTASPANPVTNITGGALGYFSAHSVRRRTVIVQ
jgi:hypothetical protein